MTTTTAHTVDTLNDFAYDDRYLGWGYIGERARAAEESPETVALMDAEVLRLANEAELTEDEFFEWANSKNGRWYVDMTFGQATGYAVRRTFLAARRYGPSRV